MENTNLVKLIKSLRKNEKRYVALYLTKHKSGNNLLKLYNIIIDNDPISDEVIAKKIRDKKFISQLKINKHNLYYLLLDALHNFHQRGSVYGRILNMLHQAEILSGKGLTIARRELLDKAGKLADEYELSELKLEILRLHNLEPNDLEFSKSLNVESKKLAERVIDENKIKYLNNRIGFYQRKTGFRVNNKQLKYLEKQIQQTAVRQSAHSDTFFNRFFSFRILSLYHAMAGGAFESYENDTKIISLFKENPKITDLQMWKDRYVSSLSRLITSSTLVGKNDMLAYLSGEIKSLDISDKRKAFADINILDAYMQLGEYEQSAPLVKQVEDNIEYYDKNLGLANRTALYFNLAVINFGIENYSRSLYWANVIINNPATQQVYDDINNIIRLLRILVYYELKYFDVLEYELRSAYRFIIGKRHLYRFDEIVLKHIRKTVSAYDRDIIRKAMQETHDSLVKISKIKVEQQTLGYFDFISWLESKLENRRFSDIVKEKVRARFTQHDAA